MRATYILSLLFCLALCAAQELETGWSNGMQPDQPDSTGWKALLSKCQPGAFIESWLVGEGDVHATAGSEKLVLRSVVSIQAICSDGEPLDAITGSAQPAQQHDSKSSGALTSPTGYSCSTLVQGSYNNGGNWMMSFMSVGQTLAKEPAAKPITLKCSRIPASYVAVGYRGAAGNAVDGLNFLMAPFPQQAPSSNKSSATEPAGGNSSAAGPDTKAPNSSGPAPPPAAPVPAPAGATAPADPKTLSIGAWIGIGASCLVGVSALVTIAYNLWKWRNKRMLVAAKSSSSSGSSKPFMV